MLTAARQWGELAEHVPNACVNIVRNPRRPVGPTSVHWVRIGSYAANGDMRIGDCACAQSRGISPDRRPGYSWTGVELGKGRGTGRGLDMKIRGIWERSARLHLETAKSL